MSAAAPKKNHVKFGDEDETTSAKVTPTVATAPAKNSRYDDSDSESDDEAPEEEGMDNVKEEIKRKQMETEALLKEEQRVLKEKRKKQNSIFKEQQAEKKSKKQQDMPEVESEEDELEELPQEFLQNIDNEVNEDKTISQHINFDDMESQMGLNPALVEEVKQQINKSKKKSLKNLRKTMAKKGPVTVQVLSSELASKVMAPKREIEVMSTRDRWLKRKALKRK